MHYVECQHRFRRISVNDSAVARGKREGRANRQAKFMVVSYV